MTPLAEARPQAQAAALAAALFAIDPSGTGGLALRARAGPQREAYLQHLRDLLPEGTPLRRLPLQAGDGRLLGGLDLAATLQAGHPVAERGILAETDGGILLLAMAERIPASTVARLSAALDTGTVRLERDGLNGQFPARLGLVALDEGIDEEALHPALAERLAFHIALDGRDAIPPAADAAGIAAARALLPLVPAEAAIVAALCEAASLLGLASLRAEILALRVARAAAALAGRRQLIEADAALAARLVLAPRARRLPADAPAETPPADQAEPPPPPADDADHDDAVADRDLADRVVAAAAAAIPPDLLQRLAAARLGPPGAGRAPAGDAGALQPAKQRGRPAGIRRGALRSGERLSVVETLRAAAPWQGLRRHAREAAPSGRIEIRPDDFRVVTFKQPSATTTIFVVDASGSLALSRLGEAKGAVELLLAECYVRRDQVALLAFRGMGAELILPPTRALARAKRQLAGLAGGGATPLAAGIDSAVALGEQLRRRGQTPVVVFLTDGRANRARDGGTGRSAAEADALSAARAARATGIRMLVIDAAPRPQPTARRLADAMAAVYLPLPHADASRLSAAVRAAAS